jgi:anti-sigma B factor antagonist
MRPMQFQVEADTGVRAVVRTDDTHHESAQRIRTVASVQTCREAAQRPILEDDQAPVVRSTAGDGQERIWIQGALDALTVGTIAPVLEAVAAAHPQQVTVDFDKVSLLDSCGVSAIVSLWKRIKAHGGSVVIVRAHDQPLMILKLLKLERVLGAA